MESWKDPSTPVIWLITGVILLLVFLGFIFILMRLYIRRIKAEAKKKEELLIQHQKELLESTIKSEEKEKKRVALSLHDDLLAQLHRIKLMNDDKTIGPLLGQSIEQIRQISHDLMPPLLDELSFDAVIMDFLQPFEKNYTISIHTNSMEDDLLHIDVKLQLFRIFQELMINITKHSKASTININWRKTSSYCCLIINDNGTGINLNSKKGLGLRNIETRAKLMDAHYKFRSAKNRGTTFSIICQL